jgi:hypothetical protein
MAPDKRDSASPGGQLSPWRLSQGEVLNCLLRRAYGPWRWPWASGWKNRHRRARYARQTRE